MQSESKSYRLLKICCFNILLGVFFLLTGCSLPTVYNLHVLDRLPHEENKGFVEFVGETVNKTAEGSISWGQVPYKIEKREHSYTVDILELSVAATSKPISDRVGTSTYIIKYPTRMLLLNYDAFVDGAVGSSKGAAANFSSAIASVRYEKKEDVWISEDDFKQEKFTLDSSQRRLIVYRIREIDVEVKRGMVTPVNLNYELSLDKGDYMQQYSGALLSVKTEVAVPIEFYADLAKGIYDKPKVYDAEFEKVFSKVLQTSKELDMEVISSDEEHGKLILQKKRFPAEPLIFTIGVFKLKPMKTGVSISSDAAWQRWGSINTNISVENINKFYQKLDYVVGL